MQFARRTSLYMKDLWLLGSLVIATKLLIHCIPVFQSVEKDCFGLLTVLVSSRGVFFRESGSPTPCGQLHCSCTTTFPEEGLSEETKTLVYQSFSQHSGIQEY